MSFLTLTGIDPGIVHTGVVVLRINTRQRHMSMEYFVIDGNAPHAAQVAELLESLAYDTEHVFIEKYLERGTVTRENPRMRELERDFRSLFPKAVFVNNTGVKGVVTTEVMKVFGMDSFPATHHQDLQSAGRILLYGALKNDKLNEVMYEIVRDYVNNHEWTVMKV